MSLAAVEFQAETLPLDPLCPWCGEEHDVGEVYDGSERRCASCGRRIVCVTWTDDTATMVRVERQPWDPLDQRTGRQRTRSLWRRRGRR